MSEWISVKDRMPVKGSRVLVLVKYLCFYEDTGYINDYVVREASCDVPKGRKKLWYLWNRPDVGTGCDGGEVTHWMSLPEPPEEEDHDNV